ncbi:MAG: Fe-S cluster assembly protein SufE, partial [Lysobacterales bacterium CG_4_9_14_3_um_filter_62_6]
MHTASARQSAIIEAFATFSDWSERYQYLIDLGRQLPEFPESLRTDE